MKAALMYCTNEFKKTLASTRNQKAIYGAFETLDIEIKKLDYLDQISLYSAITQFIESFLNNKTDMINPLDVFLLRCDYIVDGKNPTIKKMGWVLAVVAISLATIALGVAIGVGVGMLMGLWLTPLAFMAALLAVEVTPLIVASASLVAGIGVGTLSSFLFFKESGVKKAVHDCIDVIKQNHVTLSKVDNKASTSLDPIEPALKLENKTGFSLVANQ